MNAIKTTDGLAELIETADSLVKLDNYGCEDQHWAYHRAVSLIHQLCLSIRLAEKMGCNHTDIESVLEPVWELHSRSPFFRRMQLWPRGYPGDFETIEYLCECVNKALPGTSEYYIEQYALTCAMAQQHRNKVAWQASKILETCSGSSEERRILSIACGGARDLRSIQVALRVAPVQLFLNDIDPEAIVCSLNGLPHLEGKLHPVHGNVFSAVRELKKLGPFDLIVAGGLFDYLSDRQIKWLLTKLFGCLNIDGRLCFTNIVQGNPYRVWIEYLADWKLLERSEIDILNIVQNSELEELTHIGISRDQTGLAHLVELTRIA